MKKHNILKVILCLLSYMSIMYFVGNVGYGLTSNIFNMLALIPILYLFFKVHKSSKRTTFYALILAIFSGILFSLSIVTSRTLFINGASLINFKNMIKFMVLGMGLGSFFYLIFYIYIQEYYQLIHIIR